MAEDQDPFEGWRALRDEAMQAWGKAMVQTVSSEAYAQASGAMLDAYLTGAGPVRDAAEKAMTLVLQQSNMPTRADVIGIAQRLTHVEMRLDDLDAKLDKVLQQLPVQERPARKKAGGK